MSTSPVGVIFDVDGTLVDNSYLHTVAWFRACREFDLSVEMVQLHQLIGMGGDQFVPALLGREVPGLDDAHSRHFSPFEDEAPGFARAQVLLEQISARGGQVIVATSSGRAAVERVLARIAPGVRIDTLVTGDDVEATKPAPDLVAVALERSGLDRERTLFVGDTRWDVEASGRCGVRCLGVLTGGVTEAELRAAGAVWVHASVTQLADAFDSSPIAALLAG